jgi:DNA polymerase-3 subunit epsilon
VGSNPATPTKSSLCQIGYALVQDLKIVEKGFYYVQPPGNEYEGVNSMKNRTSGLDTKDSPKFPVVWEKIRNIFESNILVAHNSAFDLEVLKNTLEYYTIDFKELRCICTYKKTDLSLENLCESLEVSLTNHHHAEADAVACAESMIKLLKGHVPDESLITSKEKKNIFEAYEKVSGDVLKPNLDIEDKSSPFYAKKVVLTGVLNSMGKKETASILKNFGADVDTSISKKTRYVIAGTGAGPSKLKKIEELQAKGCDIEILFEKQFLEMIGR